MNEMKPIRVLGVGNVLCTDDGLGPYAIKVLEAQYEFPVGVEVIDVGTPGLDFTPYLAGARAAIVLDTSQPAPCACSAIRRSWPRRHLPA